MRQEIGYTLSLDRTIANPNFGDSEITGVDFSNDAVSIRFKLFHADGSDFAVAVFIKDMRLFSLRATFGQNVIDTVKIFGSQDDAMLHGNQFTRGVVGTLVDEQARMTRSFVPSTQYLVFEVNSVIDTDLVCVGSKIAMEHV